MIVTVLIKSVEEEEVCEGAFSELRANVTWNFVRLIHYTWQSTIQQAKRLVWTAHIAGV